MATRSFRGSPLQRRHFKRFRMRTALAAEVFSSESAAQAHKRLTTPLLSFAQPSPRACHSEDEQPDFRAYPQTRSLVVITSESHAILVSAAQSAAVGRSEGSAVRLEFGEHVHKALTH